MKKDERAKENIKRVPQANAKRDVIAIVISCWGFILVGTFLIMQIIEAGSFTNFLEHLAQPSLIIFYTMLSLYVPAFIVTGYLYHKLANAHDQLEQYAHEQISKSEEKFKDIFNSANDCIIFLDTSGRILDVNRKTAALFGGSEKELLGKHITNAGPFPPADMSKLMTTFNNVLQGKKAFIDLTVKNKKDQNRFLQCSVSLVKRDDKAFGMMIIARDSTERKRIEERYKRLVDLAPDGIVTVNMKGVITSCNKAMLDMTGYSRDEIVGKHFSKVGLLQAKSIPKYMKLISSILRGNAPKPFEVSWRHKDGRHHLSEIHIALMNENGKITGFQANFREITERKRAETELKNSQDRLNILFQFAPDAIYLNDMKGNFVDGNKAAEKLTGYCKNELIGKSFLKLNLLGRKQILKASKLLVKNALGKPTGPDEFVLNRKDGAQVPVEIRTFPVKIKNQTLALGIARDITERKKMEELMDLLSTAVRTSVDAISVASPVDGKLVFCNEAFLKMWKIKGDYHNLTYGDCLDVEPTSDILQKTTEATMKGGWTGELAAKTMEGQIFPVQVASSPVGDKAGRIIGLLGIFKDITLRKQMQKKLAEYSEHLEELVENRTGQLKEAQEQLLVSERLAAIGELSAMIGHDLRNPLTGIATASYYLKTKLGSKMDEKSKEMMQLIENAIKHSNKIINDLLNYAREVHLELTETTPKTIINEALSLVEAPKNIQVLDVTQNIPKIKVDVEKMKRVFVNIIKNAVDAMPEGGKLTIRNKTSGDNVEITIADTGEGIPKDILEKIWAPLYTTKAKGIGLGLPICKRIAEAHKGSISVESTIAKGTTFTITIPIKPKSEGGEEIWVKTPESLLSTTTKA